MGVEVALLARAFLLGFTIAVPIGPTGATAIRRGITGGFWAAFWVGIGAALTDFAYIILAYVGLIPLLGHIPGLTTLLYIGGSLMLFRIGYITIRDAWSGVNLPKGDLPAVSRTTTDEARSGLLSGMAVTLINPATITYWLSVGGAFVAANLVDRSLPVASLAIVMIFVGSATWFTILAGIVGVARAQVTRLPWLFRGVGILSGGILLLFAITFGWRAIERLT